MVDIPFDWSIAGHNARSKLRPGGLAIARPLLSLRMYEIIMDSVLRGHLLPATENELLDIMLIKPQLSA
jgi:hypothetical protein